jgi:NAD(P)-dependent dehydrogenase (short-subunit alcohol dehydrogenase family)
MNNKRENKAILITGTSTGIGRAAALQLDRLGYKVFATVRKEEDASSISAQASERLTPLMLDVTDRASLDHAQVVVDQQVGNAGLWGLVNNAGVGFVAPMEFVPLGDLRRLYEVNFFGLLALTQKFLPLVRKAKGRIVNISSTATSTVAPFHGPYTSAKLAVNGLTDALRLELKPLGVLVSLIIFGIVKTPIWDTAGDQSDQVSSEFPPEALELYGENLRSLRNYFNRIGQAGTSTEQATQPIVHALSAKRPKTHYFFGLNAARNNVLGRLFYGRLGDWIIMRTTGQKY